MSSSPQRRASTDSGVGVDDTTVAPPSSQTYSGPGTEMVIRLENTGLTHALEDLDRLLDLVLGESPRSLVLDLSAVERVSSTIIAALLWTRRRCASRGVRLALRNPSRHCLDMLTRAGLLGSMRVEPVDGRCGGQSPHFELL